MTVRPVLALALALACSGFALAGDSKKTPEDIADDALDVVASGRPVPHDGYMLVICGASRAAALRSDTALGAFVRYGAIVRSDLAVIVAPDGYSDQPTYVVYFAGTTPLGVATLEASDERPTDATVAKAFVAVTGPVEKKKRRAAYAKASVLVDEGSIDALRIVGWK